MLKASLPFIAVVALLLPACQTASYKATSQLAGTSWRAADRGNGARTRIEQLQFGSTLTPAGMGQVRVAAGHIVLYQVLDGRLVLRESYLSGPNRSFDFEVSGDTLTLTALPAAGQPRGSQRFVRTHSP